MCAKRVQMRKSTRSILQELNDLGTKRNLPYMIETRGSSIIDSAVNLLNLIRENYDQELAYELERRFLNAIKSADTAKFKRGVKKLHEQRQNTPKTDQ